jgi:hypothetical protein
MVTVGWVEARNPTVTRVMLGFAKLNPTYQNMGLSAVLSVSLLRRPPQLIEVPNRVFLTPIFKVLIGSAFRQFSEILMNHPG